MALILTGKLSRYRLPIGTLALALLFSPPHCVAAELKDETIQKWNVYIDAVAARNREHLAPGRSFLLSDEVPGQDEKLKAGEIVISPVGPHVPLKVPSGLIHDWFGAAFVPDVTLADVTRTLRDYSRYKDFYHPNVLDSRLIAADRQQDRFSMLLMNKTVIAKTALDSEYHSEYVRVDAKHLYCTTEATRIQEVAEFGTPAQHALPENQGTGLIWRMYSVTRFEERDGGVYIELEAVALSRDIPLTLRWLIDPIVRRVSRSSLATSLQQTECAVHSTVARRNGSRHDVLTMAGSNNASGAHANSFR